MHALKQILKGAFDMEYSTETRGTRVKRVKKTLMHDPFQTASMWFWMHEIFLGFMTDWNRCMQKNPNSIYIYYCMKGWFLHTWWVHRLGTPITTYRNYDLCGLVKVTPWFNNPESSSDSTTRGSCLAAGGHHPFSGKSMDWEIPKNPLSTFIGWTDHYNQLNRW